jgi:hypothetical protein
MHFRCIHVESGWRKRGKGSVFVVLVLQLQLLLCWSSSSMNKDDLDDATGSSFSSSSLAQVIPQQDSTNHANKKNASKRQARVRLAPKYTTN